MDNLYVFLRFTWCLDSKKMWESESEHVVFTLMSIQLGIIALFELLFINIKCCMTQKHCFNGKKIKMLLWKKLKSVSYL